MRLLLREIDDETASLFLSLVVNELLNSLMMWPFVMIVLACSGVRYDAEECVAGLWRGTEAHGHQCSKFPAGRADIIRRNHKGIH